MKKFNDCKEEIAVKHGYLGWNEFLFDNWLHDEEMNAVIDEAGELYAEEVAKAQREADAENAKLKLIRRYKNDHGFTEEDYGINKDSILSTPLVTDKK